MSEWTCPEAGWWQFGDGEPRKLSEDEVAEIDWPALPPGTTVRTVLEFDVTWHHPDYHGRLRSAAGGQAEGAAERGGQLA